MSSTFYVYMHMVAYTCLEPRNSGHYFLLCSV
uniref:Uncharacterized protein n=1 Tax=Rhizophora mucronata TaxID=61149 RepID=A0A2P2PD29_RHIMU